MKKEMTLWIGSYRQDGDNDWNIFASPKDDWDKANRNFRITYKDDHDEKWESNEWNSFEVFQITEANGYKVKLERVVE